MSAKIVLGLGFGDEGKGLVTSFLCEESLRAERKPIVIRFNGGHQAGHTVVISGPTEMRHVFSSFGSGTLQGVPTYWSKFCTFSPLAFLSEREALIKKGATPIIYVHGLCPVVTPFDQLTQQRVATLSKSHGTVGVGFGTTLQREQDHYHLYVQDLKHPAVLKEKVYAIQEYYYRKNMLMSRDILDQLQFFEKCQEVVDCIQIVNDDFHEALILDNWDFICEGAQGILLDQDFGFFPQVTRSNTTSKQAHMLGLWQNPYHIETYYVTRTYQTRHGDGFMTNFDRSYAPETAILDQKFLVNTEKETNIYNAYQGDFRRTVLDADLLNYALDCDAHFSKGNKNLVLTCCDQVPQFMFTAKEKLIKVQQYGDRLYEIPFEKLTEHLNTKFSRVLHSYGPTFQHVRRPEYRMPKGL